MQLALRVIAILSFAVATIWMIVAPGFEPLTVILASIASFLALYAIEKSKGETETLDQRNRRVMLDHVENLWVKGILEKSLHGAALLELGIREDPSAVSYPWTIKKESTNETLPAGKSMLEIFKEIGMGRSLLILGAPGSGKTTMLLELTRQLIERARQDETEPIPVVFNLASWKEYQTLADWLTEILNIDYRVQNKNAAAWINENRMLVLLDGLDEVKKESQAKCVEAINQFRKEHDLTPLVVCSRSGEYSILQTRLFLEGAITLQPLTPEQINAYIDRFGNSLASLRLLLRKDGTVQELAETPLMLSIMVLVYKDIKPEELLASNRVEEQRSYLFDTYIERMFERPTRTANSPFTKQQTMHYLSWLARMMTKQNIVTYQIEAMQPFWLEEKTQRRIYRLFVRITFILLFGLLTGIMAGLTVGLQFGLLLGLIIGLTIGVMGGLLFGLLFGIRADEIFMVDKLKWAGKGAVAWLIGGLVVGLFVGLRFGLASGLLLGLLIGLLGGFRPLEIEETTRTGQRLQQTFSNTIFVVLLNWLLFGIIGMLRGEMIEAVSVGLPGGLLFGLVLGGRSIIQHYLLRFMLVRQKLLPQRLIPFLESAVDLIFLRRVGGSYIFVHRLLMEHFAEMDV